VDSGDAAVRRWGGTSPSSGFAGVREPCASCAQGGIGEWGSSVSAAVSCAGLTTVEELLPNPRVSSVLNRAPAAC
ncbi:unnamed protein product, partial [Urochloa humidicola]